MASRMYFNTHSPGLNDVVISGAFAPNGTSAPTLLSTKRHFTVARTGVGLYTVTFDDKFFAYVSRSLSVGTSDSTPTLVQFGAWTPSAKTLVIKTFRESAGTFALADLATNADNVVSFSVTFTNTSA